jgi:hypothetical protein
VVISECLMAMATYVSQILWYGYGDTRIRYFSKNTDIHGCICFIYIYKNT